MKHSTAFNALAFAAFADCQCTQSPNQFDPSCYESSDVITRDVAIIGGGASGTYGATSLKDKGKSIVLIEREAQLGGQTNTYTVPGNGTKIDYGVIAYWNTSIAVDFFERYNVSISPLGNAVPGPGGNPAPNNYVDFTSGQNLTDSTTVNPFLNAYGTLQERYPYLQDGWDLPDPVPEDLLLKWGDYVTKYNLQDDAYNVYLASAAGGLSNILDQLTITVFKAVNQAYLQEIQQGLAIRTTDRNNHELYDAALEELGPWTLLSSTVVAAERPTDDTGVKLVVLSNDGKKRLVQASQVLVSIPPKVDAMRPFDLDSRETSLFSQFNNSAYYCGLVNNTGLPEQNYLNRGADTLYNIPAFPGLYHFDVTSYPGIFSWWWGGPETVSEEVVTNDVNTAVRKLTNNPDASPEMLAFSDHSPYGLNVDAEAIRQGFYDGINSLQGYRNTWYTGQLFTPASATLWVFTEGLMANLTAAIS